MGWLGQVEFNIIDDTCWSDIGYLIVELMSLAEILVGCEFHIGGLRPGWIVAGVDDYDGSELKIHMVGHTVVGIDPFSGNIDELQGIAIRIAIVAHGIYDNWRFLRDAYEIRSRVRRAIERVGNYTARGIILCAIGDVNHAIADDAAAIHAGMVGLAEAEIECLVQIDTLVGKQNFPACRIDDNELPRRGCNEQQAVGYGYMS